MAGKPIIVGESNPYGGDDTYALYPAPDGCSGHRLCCLILAMSRRDYLDSFERVNLLRGKWGVPMARRAADDLSGTPNKRFILLGSKVAAAFGLSFVPFGSASWRGSGFAMLPHPSGRCRLWAGPNAIQSARRAVLALAPELANVVKP
jgi:hypothetical protein